MSIKLLVHLYPKPLGHVCVGLFLGSLFQSTKLCVYPSNQYHICWRSTTQAWSHSRRVGLKIRWGGSSTSSFFSKVILAPVVSLPCQINFTILSISTKNLAGFHICNFGNISFNRIHPKYHFTI